MINRSVIGTSNDFRKSLKNFLIQNDGKEKEKDEKRVKREFKKSGTLQEGSRGAGYSPDSRRSKESER